VKEFQVQLIATVSAAVEKLQSKFTLKYEYSSAARLSKLRGIPPVAGKILWAKQMERQVHALMERCGQVLGSDWGQQLEGRQLRKSGDELLAKLDPTAFFRAWVTEWEKDLTRQAGSRLHSFPIVVEKDIRTGELVPMVNFSEKSENVQNEIKHLKWLGFEKEIPRSVLTASEEAQQRYPFAVAIKTALRSYQSVRGLVTPELEPLVMPQLLDVREIISEGFDVKLKDSKKVAKKQRIRWDSRDLSDWVTRLSDSVTKLEDRVEQLLLTCNKIDDALVQLEKVEYDATKFQSAVDFVQKAVDEISLGGYSNLETWVKVLDERLARVLAERLTDALKNWNYTYQLQKEAVEGEEDNEAGGGARNDRTIAKMTSVPSVSVEIVLRNQEISSVPAVPTVRGLFLNLLHDYIGIVCNIQRLKSGRFEVFDTIGANSSAGEERFYSCIAMVPPDIVSTAYARIGILIEDTSAFVAQWLEYQALWDTQVSDVAAAVGADIKKWQTLLMESAEARSAVDMSATSASFGPIVVKYNKVQSQITLKYDSWQKELQSSFATILGQCILDAHKKMEDAKAKLEAATLETSSGTENIVIGVTFIQEMKHNVDVWEAELEELEASERLLKRQRHHFRSDWMETSVVQGKFDMLKQLLARRSQSFDQQFPLLQTRVSAESKTAAKRNAELVSEWR
jgi:dynein heavy chain 1